MFKIQSMLLHSLAVLCTTSSLLLAAPLAKASQQDISLLCHMKPSLCRAGVPSIPSSPVEQGIRITNQGGRTLIVAYGWHETGTSAQPVGDFTLPVALSDSWAAQGWITVQPRSVYHLRPSEAAGELYLRVEAEGKTVIPTGYTATRDFCVTNQSFSSKFQTSANWFVIRHQQGSGTSGQSCTAAGGEWRTFYSVPLMTNLVVE